MTSTRFRRITTGIGAFAALAAGVLAADTQTLTVDYVLDKAVQAVWEGGDTVSAGGGDGTITLEPSVAKTAQLKVQCNSANGYSVKFSATNATAGTTSKILLGAGGSTDTELSYSCALDLDSFRSTSNITVETLHLDTNAEAVHVIFDDLAGSHVLPTDDASANLVKLLITLDTFDAYYQQEGTYTDTITAEVTIN